MSVEPFVIDIPESILDDLHARLTVTRLDPNDSATDWDAGTSPAYLRELLDYWQSDFDWRAQEANINRFAQFRARVDGSTLHFIHERGKGPAPLPLILTHGYPDSFLRFQKLIPLLIDPAAHGGNERDAFDVVVPSLPGYAFSDRPRDVGQLFHIGKLWYKLLHEELGYKKFVAHGGDWGTTVTVNLARSHPSSVIAMHLTDVPFWLTFQKTSNHTPAEEKFLAATQQFQMEEGAYAMIQGTRPQTLADGLNDSPAGLAAWLIEKFQRMSDCDGDIESRFTKDELLANVTLYWVTQTIGSSFLPYYDIGHAGAGTWIAEKMKDLIGSTKVPAAFARFPKEMTHPPREWAERFYDVQRWTDMPRGGHFAAMEEPELLAEDIRVFFRDYRRAH